VKSINNNRETFNTVVVTIDKVFTNFGTGYSFVEDTGRDSQGRKPIWNMQGTYVKGSGRIPWEGTPFEEGTKVEVDLSANPGRGDKVFYDVYRCVKVSDETPVTVFKTAEGKEQEPSSGLTQQERINMSMAFNNITVMLASKEAESIFDGDGTRLWPLSYDDAKDLWNRALAETMKGRTPFEWLLEQELPEVTEPEAQAPESTEAGDPLAELVESVPWKTEESIDSLKQKAVAMLTSNWDSPIAASEEIREALSLPSDWSDLSAEQWKSIINYAENK
tara:strand:- start:1122 stop:1952 length:831 start_codon:yes stop_codon:yes gene_type:complete